MVQSQGLKELDPLIKSGEGFVPRIHVCLGLSRPPDKFVRHSRNVSDRLQHHQVLGMKRGEEPGLTNLHASPKVCARNFEKEKQVVGISFCSANMAQTMTDVS